MEPNESLTSEPHNGTKSKSIIERIKGWYRGLPDKKRYLEFITALLTVPVLLTVLLSNYSNLKNQKQTQSPSPSPAGPTIIQIQSTPSATTTPLATPSATETPTQTSCTPGIGPISIVYPEEETTVSSDPVCLDISRTTGNYCAVVWSYRINGGSWSEYTDRDICMYSLSPGQKLLDLRVKSIANGDETILSRTFTVAGSVTPTPATSSASN